MILTKSFSPRVSRMVTMVCLAMVIRRPFMLPLTSTMMTMSLGEVAAWMYLHKKRNTRNRERVEWRISGHTHLGDVSHSMTCTVSMAIPQGPAVQQQGSCYPPASPSGSSLFTHGQELGQLQTYVQVSAKSDNCYCTILMPFSCAEQTERMPAFLCKQSHSSSCRFKKEAHVVLSM